MVRLFDSGVDKGTKTFTRNCELLHGYQIIFTNAGFGVDVHFARFELHLDVLLKNPKSLYTGFRIGIRQYACAIVNPKVLGNSAGGHFLCTKWAFDVHSVPTSSKLFEVTFDYDNIGYHNQLFPSVFEFDLWNCDFQIEWNLLLQESQGFVQQAVIHRVELQINLLREPIGF